MPSRWYPKEDQVQDEQREEGHSDEINVWVFKTPHERYRRLSNRSRLN
jgi:hypothetical protein